ncbi:trypsin-like peptidase domain-containing protein [Candidatus Azambacteria bacterium]|nr:trypsin-like peptidase domain-containing protein [Candidatus Azambacteria bacterium]
MSPIFKTILVASLASLVVSVLLFVGLIGIMQTAGIDFLGMGFGRYLPERVIIKETVKEPQVVEKYIPQTTQEQMIVDIVKRSQDAVVSVIATKDLPVLEQSFVDPFQGFGFPNDFFGGLQVPQYQQKGTEKREVSSGTGFIVSSDGLVLTNKHVVSDDNAEFTVLMNNGDKYPATVLARDPVQDIAILKIEKKGLSVLALGDSDAIETGQTVIAIGNALGEFRNTVSVGVISGMWRTITAQGGGTMETLEDLIQTDAAINPGNSGGPLFNLAGEVIGINTAMSQAAQNIGFALPVNKAKRDIEQVKKTGKISYPFLGVRYVLIDADLQKKNDLLVDYGALISRGETSADLAVTPGSPADIAGIVENDIILEANGKKITKDNPLAKTIQASKVGDAIRLKVLHKGTEKTVTATLAERK